MIEAGKRRALFRGMYRFYPQYRIQRLTMALAALATFVIAPQALAEGDYGLGQLVPGRYLNQVRKGSEDKLPEIEGSSTASDLSNFKSPPRAITAPRTAGSVPNGENFYSPNPIAAPTTVVSAPVSVPAANAAQAAFRQSAAAAALASTAEGFRAGSIGDSRGAGEVTGLGAGWGTNGNREELGFGESNPTKVDDGTLAPSPKQNAADRLLASVQVDKPAEDSAAELAQQVDQNLKGDGYRALTSILSFQEMPRGNGGSGPAEPKVLWNNPDPSGRVKSTQDVLNTMHSKDPVGQAAAAYRRTPSGAAEGTPAGAKPTGKGEAGAIGQADGIYQSGSSSGGSGQAPAAVPFQMNFPFPIPGANNVSAESSN